MFANRGILGQQGQGEWFVHEPLGMFWRFWRKDRASPGSLPSLATPTTRLSSSRQLHQDQSLPQLFPSALLSAGPLGQVALPALRCYLQPPRRNAIKLGQGSHRKASPWAHLTGCPRRSTVTKPSGAGLSPGWAVSSLCLCTVLPQVAFFFFLPHFSAAEPSPAGCPGALTCTSSSWSHWHLIRSLVALWVCWQANNLLRVAVSMLSC